jgi:hypothetical protein
LTVFTLANSLFHYEALRGDYAAQGMGLRLGLATAVMMIAVIGGRIIPSFTRNWLARTNNPARPASPMQRFDKLVLLAGIVILPLWVVQPLDRLTGIALVLFGVLHLAHTQRTPGLGSACFVSVHPCGRLCLGARPTGGQSRYCKRTAFVDGRGHRIHDIGRDDTRHAGAHRPRAGGKSDHRRDLPEPVRGSPCTAFDLAMAGYELCVRPPVAHGFCWLCPGVWPCSVSPETSE